MLSERLSSLSTVLQTSMRPHDGVSSSVASRQTASRSGVSGATTLPHAMQMMRNVQTALDWVLNKQVCLSECFHRRSFPPVNCCIIGRVHSFQVTIMKLAYWTLVCCMLVTNSHSSPISTHTHTRTRLTTLCPGLPG